MLTGYTHGGHISLYLVFYNCIDMASPWFLFTPCTLISFAFFAYVCFYYYIFLEYLCIMINFAINYCFLPSLSSLMYPPFKAKINLITEEIFRIIHAKHGTSYSFLNIVINCKSSIILKVAFETFLLFHFLNKILPLN